MPTVIVEMFEGRTIEQKRQLVDGITQSFGKIGTPGEAVHVIMHELSRQNYSTGGKLASDKT